MKNSYNRITSALGVIILLSFLSCNEEFLEVQPMGQISEQVLATKNGANKLLIGAYASLTDFGSGYNNWNGYEWTYSSLASHEAVFGIAIDPEFDAFEKNNCVPTYSTMNDTWKQLYAGVQRANDLLRLLTLIPESELPEDEALQIKGQAMFLRGIYHYYLAKTFLNVPYLDETVTFSAGNYYKPNSGPIWEEIEADFKFAGDHLNAVMPDAGRANKWAAKAFLAKIYMHQQKFGEALPLLKDCIENGVTARGEKYALYENFYDNFDSKKEGGPESVFAVQFTVNDGASNARNGNWQQIFTQPGVPECSGGMCGAVSFDLVNSYKTDSVTGLPLFDSYNETNMKNDMGLRPNNPFTPYTGTIDSRLDHTVARRGIPLLDWGKWGRYWLWDQSVSGPYGWKKYFFWKEDIDKTTQFIDWTTVNSANIDLIRFADVLLLAAECEVEAGSLSNAESLVNQVRARAANPTGWQKTYIDESDPSLGFTNTAAANYFVGLFEGQFTANGKEYARKAVRFERKIELALEGHRFFDLQRWDNGTGYMADEINAVIDHEINHTPAKNPLLKTAVFKKGVHEIYPIPQEQIDLSVVDGKSVLVQNPDY